REAFSARRHRLARTIVQKHHSPARYCNPHLHILESPDDLHVQMLLDIHVQRILGAHHVVHALNQKRLLTHGRKVGAVEPGIRRLGNYLPDHRRNLPQTGRGSSVLHTDREGYAPFSHALVVVDARPGEIGVRHDHLLAAQAPDPGRPEPHFLHRAGNLVHCYRIANHEWLVEHDGKGGNEVAEHTLYCQGNCNSTDSQAGNERGNVYANRLQRNKKEYYRHNELEHQHRRSNGGHTCSVCRQLLPREAPQPGVEQCIAPVCNLHQQQQHERHVKQALHSIREVEEARGNYHTQKRSEEVARAMHELNEHVVHAGFGGLDARHDSILQQAAHNEEYPKCYREREQRHEPRAYRIPRKLEFENVRLAGHWWILRNG